MIWRFILWSERFAYNYRVRRNLLRMRWFSSVVGALLDRRRTK